MEENAVADQEHKSLKIKINFWPCRQIGGVWYYACQSLIYFFIVTQGTLFSYSTRVNTVDHNGELQIPSDLKWLQFPWKENSTISSTRIHTHSHTQTNKQKKKERKRLSVRVDLVLWRLCECELNTDTWLRCHTGHWLTNLVMCPCSGSHLHAHHTWT